MTAHCSDYQVSYMPLHSSALVLINQKMEENKKSLSNCIYIMRRIKSMFILVL